MSEDNDFANMQDSDGPANSNYISLDLQDVKQIQQPVPIEATHCRKGTYIIVKDCPCKIADLKISKTGKHGHAKANMVGYDIVTGKKYQETVPGHITMFEFTPVKIEYDVTDIKGTEIHAMDGEGEQYVFNVPDNPEVGEKLIADFKDNEAKKGDKFFIITVLYCPRMVGKKWMANLFVESYKLGKD